MKSMISRMKYGENYDNSCDSCSRKYENKFHIFVKDGEETIYNSGLAGSMAFDSTESIHKFLEEKYKQDKIRYLLTGTWPNVRFFYHDSSWAYYNCLKLRDPEVTLKKFFDFDYYSPDWPREKLIELTDKYGDGILFPFLIYSDSNPNMSFEDWLKDYNEYLERNGVPPYIDCKEKRSNDSSNDSSQYCYSLLMKMAARIK